jgi:hypothetical protein
MAHGRIVYRRHANAYSNTRANSNTRADADTRPHANSDTDPRPGMQWDSDLDRGRDLYRRPAREPERLHL